MPWFKNKKTGVVIDLPNKPTGDDWVEVAEEGGGSASKYDQTKDPSGLLGAYGFTWQSGTGPYAVWKMPDADGTLISEASAVKLIQQQETAPPKAPAAGERGYSPPPITPYQQAELGLAGARIGEDQRQFDLGTREAQRQFDLTQQRLLADMEMRRTQTEADLRLQTQLLDFNKSKEQYAQATGNKRLELDTQAQMFQQQATIQNLISQRDQANAEIDQFNARMAFDAQQLDVTREENRQDRLAQNNRDIAGFAAKPVDYGAAASFALAHGGWGQQDAALAQGADLRTDRALEPLQGGLNLREILGRPITPTVAPQAARLGPLDLSALRGGGGGGGSDAANSGAYRTLADTGQEASLRAAGLDDAGLAAIRAAGGLTPAAITALTEAQRAGTIPAAAGGGVMDGAYISGERGPEINIPTPNGAVVLNQQQAKKMGIDLKALMKNPEVKKMATGGVFSGLSTPATAGARSFADAGVSAARQGTPWSSGVLPTPVFASSPGTSPIVAQLLAGLRQQASGYPAEEFMRQAGLLAPTGMSERVVGRSA